MIKADEKTISSIIHRNPPLTGPPTPPIASTPSPVTTHQQDHMTNTNTLANTTMAECPEAEGNRDEGTLSRNRGNLSRDISSSDEEMRMRLEGLEVDIGREQSAQYSSSARKNAPVLVI